MKTMRIQLQRRNLDGALRIMQHGLLGAGSICVGLFCWYQFEASYYQAKLQRAFQRGADQISAQNGLSRPKDGEDIPIVKIEIKEARGNHDAAPEPVVAEKVVGRLEIPRIALKVMVLEGVGENTLRRAAGWVPDTAFPGEAGNAGIAAHRDMHFRPLRLVRKGDLIHFATLSQSYRYRVDWIAVVDPANTQVIGQTAKPSMTLITCYPFDYVGRAPKRFVVRARLVD